MTRDVTSRGTRGFTLIELMIVVSIIGIIASMAVPSLTRMSLRAKTAERTMLMLRIKQQIEDYYRRNGAATPIGVTDVDSGSNPVTTLSATRRSMSDSIANWNIYFSSAGENGSVTQELEGAVYYTYRFVVHDDGAASTIDVFATGDLDGDGIPSPKQMSWVRVNGVYQPATVPESPPAGQEDAGTF